MKDMDDQTPRTVPIQSATFSNPINAEIRRAAAMSVFGMLNWFYMWNTRQDAKGRAAYAKTVAQMTMGGVRNIRRS